MGRLTWVSLEIHRSRAELMLRKKVANKIPREVVGCDLANGGRGGRVTPKDGCFTINFQGFRDGQHMDLAERC